MFTPRMLGFVLEMMIVFKMIDTLLISALLAGEKYLEAVVTITSSIKRSHLKIFVRFMLQEDCISCFWISLLTRLSPHARTNAQLDSPHPRKRLWPKIVLIMLSSALVLDFSFDMIEAGFKLVRFGYLMRTEDYVQTTNFAHLTFTVYKCDVWERVPGIITDSNHGVFVNPWVSVIASVSQYGALYDTLSRTG